MKRILIITFCVVFLLTMSVGAAATNENTELDIRQNISDSWLALYGSGLSWDDEALYYGSFGNCSIFLLNGPIPDESIMEVVGFTFWYHGSFQIYAFDGDAFFTLLEAYDAGLLTREDVGMVYSAHTQYNNAAGEQTDWNSVDWEHFDWKLLDDGETSRSLRDWLKDEADLKAVFLLRENCAHAAFSETVSGIISDRFFEEPQAMLLAIAGENEEKRSGLAATIVLGTDDPDQLPGFLTNLRISGSNAAKCNKVLKLVIEHTESLLGVDIFNPNTGDVLTPVITASAVMLISASGVLYCRKKKIEP